MLEFGAGLGLHTLPEPAGALGEPSRLHLLGLFAGNADPPVVVVTKGNLIIPVGRRRRR